MRLAVSEYGVSVTYGERRGALVSDFTVSQVDAEDFE